MLHWSKITYYACNCISFELMHVFISASIAPLPPLQLTHEFDQEMQESMKPKLLKNWHKICQKLSNLQDVPTFEEEVKSLEIIIKNVYQRPPEMNVVNVTPVS